MSVAVVGQHSRSEHPVGVFLSGGLDSTAVAAYGLNQGVSLSGLSWALPKDHNQHGLAALSWRRGLGCRDRLGSGAAAGLGARGWTGGETSADFAAVSQIF